VDDLVKSGVDFIKIQSLIPRMATSPLSLKPGTCTFPSWAMYRHGQGIRSFECRQKSIEHFTGVFEGCSTIEDALLKGPKGRAWFRHLRPARAPCSSTFREEPDLQVPTLVWERGQWLIDEIDLSHDPHTKYAPAAWKDRTWPCSQKIF